MLVLSRKYGESVVLPRQHIRITVMKVFPGRVQLGIEAPRDIEIVRGELLTMQKTCEQFVTLDELERLTA